MRALFAALVLSVWVERTEPVCRWFKHTTNPMRRLPPAGRLYSTKRETTGDAPRSRVRTFPTHAEAVFVFTDDGRKLTAHTIAVLAP